MIGVDELRALLEPTPEPAAAVAEVPREPYRGPRRIVAYTRRDAGEAAQYQRISAYLQECRYRLVGMASDPVGEAAGWSSALRMVAEGEADGIVVAPGVMPPIAVEVAGTAAPSPRRRAKRVGGGW